MRRFLSLTNRTLITVVKLEHWDQTTKNVTAKVKQTFGMIGACSFLCFKPSQLKPSNHLNTHIKTFSEVVKLFTSGQGKERTIAFSLFLRRTDLKTTFLSTLFESAYRVDRKPVNANPGLKVNKSINISGINFFFSMFMCCVV